VFPLLNDLRSQAASVRSFILKATLLLILFFILDHVLGRVFVGGLDRYYGLNEPAAVLCVGHSHTVLGIDKVELERQLGVPVAKFAVEGANTADRAMMIRYYFSRHPKSVRAVVYDVDAHTFTGTGLSSSSYQLLFPFIDDPEIRAYVKQNCASSAEYWLRRLFCLPRYNELTLSLAVRGYLHRWTSFKFGKVDVNRLAKEIHEGRFLRIEFDQENCKEFDRTTAFVSSQGSSLFLAYLPTIDVFNAAEPEKFGVAMEIFKSYAATNSSITFLDYNKEFQSQHDLFRDPIHLNRDGQRKVTARLAEDLKRFLQKQNAVERSLMESTTSRGAL
jgi:hypothetical protein